MPIQKELPGEALKSLKAKLGSDTSGYRYGVGLKRSQGDVLHEVALIVYVPEKLPGVAPL